ncbi:MAG: PadR family transcriptional regulator [Gemmatimonadales bacterium]
MLGELEQLVLLAVMHVGDDAYGIPVRDAIERRTSRDLTFGTIYKTLNRMEDKGLVRSRLGPDSAARGGRRTRCYVVTAAGRHALRESLGALRRMMADLDVGWESP